MSENIGKLTTPSGEGASIEVLENNSININGNLGFNNNVKFNKNVFFNGGSQIGFNPEFPNELVISADGFDVDGSCISIFQQDNTTISEDGLVSDKGAIKLFSRDIDQDKCTWIAIHTNPSKVYIGNTIDYIKNHPGIYQYFGYLNGIEDEYYSINSWYRKWTNGWVEQGGRIVIDNTEQVAGNYTTAVLTFPIPFKECYHWLCQAKHDRFNSGFVADGILTTSVNVYQVNDSEGSFSNPFVIWYAVGYYK